MNVNLLDRPLTRNIHADRRPIDFSDYEANGGYQGLRVASRNNTSKKHLQEIVSTTLSLLNINH